MRRADDDAKLARAVVQLAEEVKGIAHYLFDGDANEDATAIVARMDEVIASVRSVNAGHAVPKPAPEAAIPVPAGGTREAPVGRAVVAQDAPERKQRRDPPLGHHRHPARLVRRVGHHHRSAR